MFESPSESEGLTPNAIQHYKRLEEVFNYNLQVYKSLFYHNPEGVFSLDLKGRFTSANKAMAIKCGCLEEDFLSKDYMSFVPSEHRQLALATFNETIQGKVKKIEVTVGISGLKELMVSLKSIPIYVDKKIVGIYCIVSDITKRKQNDRRIHDTLGKLQDANREKDQILESITEGFLAIDNNWNFLYCNQVIADTFRIDKDTITGKNFWDLMVLAHSTPVLVQFTKAMIEKKKVNFEFYYSPLKLWFHITVYPSRNGLSSIFKLNNEPKRLELLFNLEKQALELNANLESSLDEIVKCLVDGIQLIHPDMICGLLAVRNGSLYNWYSSKLPEDYIRLIDGLKVGIGVGSCGTAAAMKDTVIVENIETNEHFRNYLEQIRPFGFKACWSMPLMTKDKEVFATFATYYTTVRKPTLEEMNSIEKVKNLLATIIINKQAEEELMASNERYDIVAKATNDAIWDFDPKTGGILWNNGLKTIFGYQDAPETCNMGWAIQQVHPNDRTNMIRKISQQMADLPGTSFSHEFRFRCADGSYKYVQNNMFVITDPRTAKAARIIGALQDVSRLKENENKLLELNNALKQRAAQLALSNAELEKFAYVASHDLQEPLRTITSFLQLFKRRYTGLVDETGDKYIQLSVDGAERMKTLIQDMLEYSRVNNKEIRTEEVDLKKVVDDVKLNFSEKIKKANATVNVLHPLPKIIAARTQMLQLFQNLIGNGIKYHRPGVPPIVEITCLEKEKECIFSIRDNGIGIEEKFHAKIFIIFQRLHSKAQYEGTGIGLSICKKIVEKQGGRIWIESQPGEGSVFHFTLPKVPVSTESIHEAEESAFVL